MVEHAEGAQVSCPAIVARRDFARASANEAEHERIVLLDVLGDHGLGQVTVFSADVILESAKFDRVRNPLAIRLKLTSESAIVT